MAFDPLNPEKFGPNAPLDISNLVALFKGKNKTNGFLMRNVDFRLSALVQPIGRMSIDDVNVLGDDGVIPYGNGLWRDIPTMATRSGIAHGQKPAQGFLAGVLNFNQGVQAGHPVMPHGVPFYSKGEVITKGLVAYKTAMTDIGLEEEYLSFLKGNAQQNIPATRTTYTEWMVALQAGGDGAKLGLFLANSSGFPVVKVVAAAAQANPTLAGATFAGFGIVFERENEAVFFDIDL